MEYENREECIWKISVISCNIPVPSRYRVWKDHEMEEMQCDHLRACRKSPSHPRQRARHSSRPVDRWDSECQRPSTSLQTSKSQAKPTRSQQTLVMHAIFTQDSWRFHILTLKLETEQTFKYETSILKSLSPLQGVWGTFGENVQAGRRFNKSYLPWALGDSVRVFSFVQ
jgi:hypothetical protein